MANSTVTLLKTKLYIMRILAIVLLVWLYATAIKGLIIIFSPMIGLPYDATTLAFLFSIFGTFLGFLFYGLSLLKPKIKRYLKIGIPGSIGLIIVGSYFLFGGKVFFDVFVFFIKVGFGLILSTMPLVGVYGLFKKHRTTILAAGAGILFFFFFTRVLMGEFVFATEQAELLILFFILLICYLEVGASSVFYSESLEKMAPRGEGNEQMIKRLSNVITRYFIFVFIVLIVCYFVTFFLYFYRNVIISSAPGGLLGVDPGSIYGLWILVVIIVLGTFLFWYFIPRERAKLLEDELSS